MLRESNWKPVYRTGKDDLLNDFYIKALKSAVSYDRAVGYFSSHMLAFASSGLSELIRNNGSMRLIIGDPLDADEYEAVKTGKDLSWAYQNLERRILATLEGHYGPVASHRLTLLTWLLTCGRLEIKFAFRRKGMYHEKIGIISDASGDKLVFHGSPNETLYALDVDSNAESLSVFPSWKEAVFAEYGQPYIDGFEELWQGRQLDTATLDLPSDVYERIAKAAALDQLPNLDVEADLANSAALLGIGEQAPTESLPSVPVVLGGRTFKIREHQQDALNRWKASEYRGILQLATGSGKTITAIYGAVKLYQAANKLALIVAAPYVDLALQWVDNLRLFSIHPHKCFDSKASWYESFKLDIQAFASNEKTFLAAVVVNRTLQSDAFQGLIEKLPKGNTMFVGDECHRHGAALMNSVLPDVDLRLGLSATPFQSDEDELESPFPDLAKQRLLAYYGPVVSEYTLADAINDDVLTPYEYFVHPVRLTEDEQDRYDEVSEKIGRLVSSGVSLSGGDSASNTLTSLCGERSRLLGGASNKLPELRRVLRETNEAERSHTLFYCAEGAPQDEDYDLKHIETISTLLVREGWRVSHFTANESKSERRRIMDSFITTGIDALVSMKVLDEGIDVPVCDTAYLLASTKNPRQYVQRRGRILRKSPGKDTARIHDFVVLPCFGSENSKYGRQLTQSELKRVYDFLLLATNGNSVYKTLEAEGVEL